jgi:formamidopyrimidine-DNA glycosylase
MVSWSKFSSYGTVLVSFLSVVARKKAVLALGGNSVLRNQIRMVEGHSVHRVASLHTERLVGKKFRAWSPNGRFTDGATAINGKTFSRIEAVGKNLFAFFVDEEKKDPAEVVVHVHFGMSGRWAVYLNDEKPEEPTKTNRLRLEFPGIVADLSAMTVQHGGIELYQEKRAKLGEDPLRHDADPAALWVRVKKSKKSIGALIMDQSYFTGPGNIYRAEILFKAGVHPNKRGMELDKTEFDSIWYHTVALLKRGYETGSILTVDPEEAVSLGKPRLRRYIYNSSKCPRCDSPIKTWQIANRTCYACVKCQPITSNSSSKSDVTSTVQNHKTFNSHCARESVETRLIESGPERLTVKEIKSELTTLGVNFSSKAKKAELVEILTQAQQQKMKALPAPAFVSPEDAALEKAQAGENLAIEHIAELASGQARKARAIVETRLIESGPDRLTVKEIKSELTTLGVDFSSKAKKAALVEILTQAQQQEKKALPAPAFVSPEDAALEKAEAGENLAIEHIAELAPSQARKARKRVLFPDTIESEGTKKIKQESLSEEENNERKPASKRRPTRKKLTSSK